MISFKDYMLLNEGDPEMVTIDGEHYYYTTSAPCAYWITDDEQYLVAFACPYTITADKKIVPDYKTGEIFLYNENGIVDKFSKHLAYAGHVRIEAAIINYKASRRAKHKDLWHKSTEGLTLRGSAWPIPSYPNGWVSSNWERPYTNKDKKLITSFISMYYKQPAVVIFEDYENKIRDAGEAIKKLGKPQAQVSPETKALQKKLMGLKGQLHLNTAGDRTKILAQIEEIEKKLGIKSMADSRDSLKGSRKYDRIAGKYLPAELNALTRTSESYGGA